ncbi:MAG: hypothetical protein M0R17_05040 [Candidatus Omnitrophica bacterium]|jgi:hypothetical protein|nr:hypothetical protein [Candidatus Omnitrophota bacterium]
MNIKTDSYYVIGRSHNYCQDYAYAYSNKICLSDGCSLTSKDGICTPHKTSDIAARLLCRMDINLLHPSILHLSDISLDATYLECSHEKDNTVKLTIIGDGVIYIKTDVEEKIIIRSYNPNTPLYMSYVYDENGRDMYEKFKPILTERVINLTTGEDTSNQIENSPYYGKNVQILENIKTISLFSDGVTDIYGIDVKEAVIALVSFKRTNNQFVMARMKAQLREWNSRDIYPNDDLSMATMIIEEYLCHI